MARLLSDGARVCPFSYDRLSLRGNLHPAGTFRLEHLLRDSQSTLVIRTKSLLSPSERHGDGLRILGARFRGRGLPTSRYDVWMANLGPSEKLLRQFQSGSIPWDECCRRYQKELFESESLDRRNTTIKNLGQKFTLRLLQTLDRRGPVTLLCHCAETEEPCHRHLRRKVLEGKA